MNQRVKRRYGNNFLLRSLRVKLPCYTRERKDTSNDSKTLTVKWWHISFTNSMKKWPQRLIKKWEDCREQEGISMVIFNKKEHWREENAMSGFRTDSIYRNRARTSTEQTRNRNFRAHEGSGDVQQDKRRPFFGEFRPRSLSRNRRPNRYRNTFQSHGRRPMRGRTQRRQDNRTVQRERFPSQNREIDRNYRSRNSTRPMQRNEPVGIQQPERNLEEKIIVPETQVEQPTTAPNARINSQNVERSEGNDNLLFHGQGSNNANINNNNQ